MTSGVGFYGPGPRASATATSLVLCVNSKLRDWISESGSYTACNLISVLLKFCVPVIS